MANKLQRIKGHTEDTALENNNLVAIFYAPRCQATKSVQMTIQHSHKEFCLQA